MGGGGGGGGAFRVFMTEIMSYFIKSLIHQLLNCSGARSSILSQNSSLYDSLNDSIVSFFDLIKNQILILGDVEQEES